MMALLQDRLEAGGWRLEVEGELELPVTSHADAETPPPARIGFYPQPPASSLQPASKCGAPL
jgi:hypothetical protein